jgi:hypothetical protein
MEKREKLQSRGSKVAPVFRHVLYTRTRSESWKYVIENMNLSVESVSKIEMGIEAI